MTVQVTVDTTALTSFITAADEIASGRSSPANAWAGYEQQHADVFARYLDGWGTQDRRPAAAAAMVTTAARLRASAMDWPVVLEQIAGVLTPLVGVDLEVPVVVFVGMGTSNGWVTTVGGRQTVFLAAELTPVPALAAVLAAHEITHALQALLTPAWDSVDYPVGAHTYAEGLATYVSAVAVPGHRDDEYLWNDALHERWLSDCEQFWSTATAELRDVLDQPCGGPGETRFFTFRPHVDDPGIPSRFGYYAGLHIVRAIAATRTVADLLTLDLQTAHQLTREYLDPPMASPAP